MIETVKHWLRSGMYHSGLLGVIHYLRNRNTLTVFMFHRVLPAESPSIERAEREFAFTVEGFGKCLDFIRRHYVPVDLTQVEDAASGKCRLPSRAALISFDDGWRDTVTYALPELKRRNMPAVLFLSTEVCSLKDIRWWQDWLVEALLLPGSVHKLVEFLQIDDADCPQGELRGLLTARLSELPPKERSYVLERCVPASATERQMLSDGDLQRLSPLIQVAGHGHCHGPLTHLRDPGSDLSACRAVLLGLDAHSETLSFPHGATDDRVVKTARQAGFRYLFSSDPHLVSLRSGMLGGDAVLGRIHLPENRWTCDKQGISNPKLATYLFFRRAL